jgi:hypothetical protein
MPSADEMAEDLLCLEAGSIPIALLLMQEGLRLWGRILIRSDECPSDGYPGINPN